METFLANYLYPLNPLKRGNNCVSALLRLLPVILFFSCTALKTEKVQKNDFPIIFGNGGGFTGKLMEYTLTGTGEIFQKTGLKGQTRKVKTLTPVETAEIYNKFRQISFDKIQFKHPGNLYYFLRSGSGGNYHEVTWGDNKFACPDAVSEFYKFIIEKLK